MTTFAEVAESVALDTVHAFGFTAACLTGRGADGGLDVVDPADGRRHRG
jgi:hypothetical protein